MKNILLFFFACFTVGAWAQIPTNPIVTGSVDANPEVMEEEVCWSVGGVDSSLTRFYYVDPSDTSKNQVLFYVNSSGDRVTVSGGTLTLGYCGCCDVSSGSVVNASNGLNDMDTTGYVDVELGGTMERNTLVEGASFNLEWQRFQNYWVRDLQGQFWAETDTLGNNQGMLLLNPSGYTLRTSNYTLDKKGEIYSNLSGAVTMRSANLDSSFPSIVNVSSSGLEVIRKSNSDTSQIIFNADSATIKSTLPLDIHSSSGISLFEGKYPMANAEPGAGQKVMVWNAGTATFEDYLTASNVVAFETQSIGNFQADITRIAGAATTVTNPSAGNYSIDIAAGAHLDGIRIFGDNTTLNASQEMIIEIDNSLNGYASTFIVQLYDANNNALVDQQATATVHTQEMVGNVTTILIPGLNGFGSTGYYVELR